jgi:RND family efflux transporter MFP subunit
LEFDVIATNLEMAKAKLLEAEAELIQAKLLLSFADIKAPFDGVINRIPYRRGSFVEEGTLLTTISNNEQVFVYFNVAERDYLNFVFNDINYRTQDVGLVLANGLRYEHQGVIETNDAEFNPSTGTVAFRARFPNPNRILLHGLTGKVLLSVFVKDALIIPQKATFNRQEYKCVYVVNNGIVEIKKIKILANLPQFYIIEEGLSFDDKILYEGILRVKEGERIETEELHF